VNGCCKRSKDHGNGPKKFHCGICVKDCGNEAYKVLNFFHLNGTERDVDGSIGGGGICRDPNPEVCCTPKDQTMFTYDSTGQVCLGWFVNGTSIPMATPVPPKKSDKKV
jgi:hypothetical protein